MICSGRNQIVCNLEEGKAARCDKTCSSTKLCKRFSGYKGTGFSDFQGLKLKPDLLNPAIPGAPGKRNERLSSRRRS